MTSPRSKRILLHPTKHQEYTGRSNGLILCNFRELMRLAGDRIVPRAPLGPGFKADSRNLAEIVRFFKK